MIRKKKGWKEIPIGGVCWLQSTEYETGDWKTFEPKLDQEKCTKCLICHIQCPDGAIEWKQESEEVVFLQKYCKGCGICANECPAGAIAMVLE